MQMFIKISFKNFIKVSFTLYYYKYIKVENHIYIYLLICLIDTLKNVGLAGMGAQKKEWYAVECD